MREYGLWQCMLSGRHQRNIFKIMIEFNPPCLNFPEQDCLDTCPYRESAQRELKKQARETGTDPLSARISLRTLHSKLRKSAPEFYEVMTRTRKVVSRFRGTLCGCPHALRNNGNYP